MSENKTIKIDGKWNGKPVSIKNEWGGHEFTDEEVQKLFNNEIIEFEAISKNGNTYTAKGKIEEQEYNGQTFIGFKPIFDKKDDDRIEGVWKDHPVSIKKEWGGHTFTAEEITKLFADKTIEFEAVSKTGKPYSVKGKLAKQEFNGNSFIGFKPIFEQKENTPDTDRVEGVWNGRTVKFKKEWGGHKFTKEECDKLLNGDVIEFSAVSKAGKSYIARGALAEQEYNGNKFIGFKLNFG
jgi:DNA topoisomerase-3